MMVGLNGSWGSVASAIPMAEFRPVDDPDYEWEDESPYLLGQKTHLPKNRQLCRGSWAKPDQADRILNGAPGEKLLWSSAMRSVWHCAAKALSCRMLDLG